MEGNYINRNDVEPHSFTEILLLWLKVFQMNEGFFASELPRSSVYSTVFGLLIYTGVTVFLGVIQNSIGTLANELQKTAPDISTGQFGMCYPFILLVATPLGYYIGVGITHFFAMLYGGKGTFSNLAYLLSLFYFPLGIIANLVNLIPCVGIIVSLGISIYMIVLSVRAIKVNYQLTTGKAVWAELTPVVALIALIACGSIAMVSMLGPTIGSVFSNVIQNLGTPVP